MSTIILLWPTIRPTTMLETYNYWMSNADHPSNVALKVAVNTEEQRSQLPGKDVIAVGDERKGVTHACCILSKLLMANDDDIVILASDDMYASKGWDTWTVKRLNGKTAALMVNDGYAIQDCMTIPIMTFSCLKKLNKIIYHYSYKHQYSDNELYYNLIGLGLMLDVRNDGVMFEHRHWARSMRTRDEHDDYYAHVANEDAQNWSARQKMSISERLN